MATDGLCAWWMQVCVSGRNRNRAEVPAVQAEGWGRRPEPPPPLFDRNLVWLDYLGCFVAAISIWSLSMEFRGFLLDDEYSVVNVLALLLTRIHMLVTMMSSAAPSTWTALALLPTCPAPAPSTPPVCHEWEKPTAAAIVLPGSSGTVNSNWWRSHEHNGDYNAAKKCFDSLVRDAAWTCDEQDNDYKEAVECFDSLLRDAARICFVWSYDAISLTRQSDDPPPT